MRVLFLGTPEFAVPSLRALAGSRHLEVVGVITQPDRRSGRGLRVSPPPVKVFAQTSSLPVFQPEKIRGNPEALALLPHLAPDVAVVVAFGQILPEAFFAFPAWGTLNVHASILPAYRGAAPIAHALLKGEVETGVTIMKIDAGMDTGPVLGESRVPVPLEMNAGELEFVLAQKGADLLIPTLEAYVSGRIVPVSQRHEEASYAPRLKKEDGRIDWQVDSHEVHNRIRAMNPWPGAFADWRGEEVKIWRSMPYEPGDPTDSQPGRILGLGDGGLLVRCGTGTLRVDELQLLNRKRVGARDFFNGVRAGIGECFH